MTPDLDERIKNMLGWAHWKRLEIPQWAGVTEEAKQNEREFVQTIEDMAAEIRRLREFADILCGERNKAEAERDALRAEVERLKGSAGT